MSNYLRPDEIESQADIERSREYDKKINSGVKSAASLATGLGAAGIAAKTLGPLSSKILPFINKYIPTDLAIKGISKVSPELGGLLKKGISQGLDIKDGLDFIKGQIDKNQEPAKQNRNIIEQYDPELHQFILQQIKSGRSPLEAGALAQQDKKGGNRFISAINKLVKDHKAPWSAILESVYGGQAQAQAQTQQPQQGTSDDELLSRFQNLLKM